MKLNKITIASSFLLLAALHYGCRKISETVAGQLLQNVEVTLNGEIFEYLVEVQVGNAANPGVPVPDCKIFIEGDDEMHIFSMEGTREFKLSDGKITLGLNPDRKPFSGQPVKFNVVINADGFAPVSKEVIIYENQKVQAFKLDMINYSAPPSYLDIEVQNYTLSNGTLTSDQFIKKGKKADSVYYDDGLSTVVLPQGTGFDYWEYGKTGTAMADRGTRKLDTIMINGKMQVFTRVVYDSIVDVFGLVKKSYSGSFLQVETTYDSSMSSSMDFAYYSDERADMIEIMSGPSVRMDELLYKTAVRKRLLSVAFRGKDQKGKLIYLYPDAQSKWFTSLVIDPNFLHPLTNQPIKEGDQLEVGIDYATKKTVRTEVLKAANGELRIQARNLNDGCVYYKAPHIYTCNYQVDATPNTIPDYENLKAYHYINLGANKGIWNYITAHGVYNLNYKVISATPITSNVASIQVYYFGKFLGQRMVQQGPVQAFPASVFSSLPSPVAFLLHLRCPAAPVKEGDPATAFGVKPSGLFGVNNMGTDYYAHLVNGYWQTRGIQLNTPIRIFIQQDNIGVDTTITVTETENEIEYMMKSRNNPYCK